MVQFKKYVDLKYEDFHSTYESNMALLVTATKLETANLHKNLEGIDENNSIFRIYIDDITVYFARFGCYNVLHVECSIGTTSRDSSIVTVTKTLSKFNIKIVIMIGVAFGIDSEKQNIGDVLVSEAIRPYNYKKVKKNKIIQRGIDAPSSKTLFNRFKNIKNWDYKLIKCEKAKVFHTQILSGEVLIDDKNYRDKLIETFPEAKGGEMEGAGIYAACDGNADWIVVKAICDFADGNKSTNKDKNQVLAISSAISLCRELFISRTAFEYASIFPFDAEKETTDFKDYKKASDILFDIYELSKEPFYIVREEDGLFNSYLINYGIWYFGPTGCGKSNLVLRNLSIAKKSFLQVSLAGCVNTNIDDYFKEVLYDLYIYNGEVVIDNKLESFNNISRQLIQLLKKYYSEKEFYIYLEEIPISTDKEFKDFTEKLNSIIINKNIFPQLNNVKFILSTLNSPNNHIPVFQHKILQQMKIIELFYWKINDINLLIDMITTQLNFKLTKDMRSSIIRKGNNSPRFIKKYFRNLFSLQNFSKEGLTNCLALTELESNL